MGLFRRAKGICPSCGKEKRAEKAQPKAQEIEVTCRCGITFRIPIGSDWWIAYRDPDGRYVRRRIGPSKRAAERIFRKVKTELVEGQYVDRRAKCKVTLGELVSKYKEHVKPLRKQYNFEREVSAMNHLVEEIGAGQPIANIEEKEIEAYRAARKGASVATINRELAILSASLTWAIKQRWIRTRPRFTLPNPRNTRTRFLTKDEARQLIEACPDGLRPFVQTALFTGMRRGEILAMEWSWIDLHRSMIDIPGTATKNGEGRHVPIIPSMRRVLEEARDRAMVDCPFVFPASGRKTTFWAFGSAWRQTIKKLGIVDLRFHDLRHTFASWLVQAGESLYTVAAILGHKDLKMTQRYSHLAPGHLQAAAEHANLDLEIEPAEDAIRANTGQIIDFPSAAKSVH